MPSGARGRAGWAIGRLIHLNGPPGIGKSTLADRWADGPAGAVVIDIDLIRVSLDGWQQDERSRLEARRLALVQIDEQLRAGQDVIVPQYLGRPEFITELERTADRAHAKFVEIWLSADEDEVVARFETRRANGVVHPEGEVLDVRSTVAEAIAQLRRLARLRPQAQTIDADD